MFLINFDEFIESLCFDMNVGLIKIVMKEIKIFFCDFGGIVHKFVLFVAGRRVFFDYLSGHHFADCY